MYLVLRFGTTDCCVGMLSLKVNSYSNILLLYLGYNSVITISGKIKKRVASCLICNRCKIKKN